MQRRRYFEGLKSKAIFDIMKKMLDDELFMEYGFINKDKYEWVIGADVWVRIASNINDFDISWSDTNEEPICKIFGIEVTISTKELNTVTLRKKDERGNEMPTNYSGSFETVSWVYLDSIPTIKKVIFNYPATIVLWSDGSKTLV